MTQIIVFGGKGTKNAIDIDPSVTVPATISGGQGIKNRNYGGGGRRENTAGSGTTP